MFQGYIPLDIMYRCSSSWWYDICLFDNFNQTIYCYSVNRNEEEHYIRVFSGFILYVVCTMYTYMYMAFRIPDSEFRAYRLLYIRKSNEMKAKYVRVHNGEKKKIWRSVYRCYTDIFSVSSACVLLLRIMHFFYAIQQYFAFFQRMHNRLFFFFFSLLLFFDIHLHSYS